MKSDASALTELEAISRLYLDKVGSMRVNKDTVRILIAHIMRQ